MSRQSLSMALGHRAAGRHTRAEAMLAASADQLEPERSRLQALCAAELGRTSESERILANLTRRFPASPIIQSDLGVLLFRAGRWRAACARFRRALSLDPEDHESALGLAAALRQSGRAKDSVAEYRRLIETGHRLAVALEGLYLAAGEAGDLESILPDIQRVLRRNPRCPTAHSILAEILFDQSEGARACDHLKREARLSLAQIDSMRIYYSLGSPSQTPAAECRRIGGWIRKYTPAPKASMAPARPVRSRGKLRVGYLTGEFTRVPAYYFVFPLVKYHNPEAVNIYGYHSRAREDDRTDEFRALTTRFHSVSNWSDDRIADQVRRDGIDVLVDLSGHFDDQRLAVFRQRPAPVSFSYPNHPSTTGVQEIDYIFTDRWIDPAGSPRKYVERPWHLAGGYLPFMGIPFAPAVAPPPAVRNGFITFGVLQKALKLNNVVFDCLAGALLETPRSRLILRYNSEDLENRNSAASQRLLGEFRKRGVSPDRIQLGGNLRRAKYLAIRREFDIALDTFPYNGQTTTCDSLWMGVPTVTMAGDTHVSRVGYSLMARLGLEDWTASSVKEYAAVAARQAGRISDLVELRRNLRGLVRKHLSPRTVGKEVEHAYLAAAGRS
ncbi:tetratricopeptide repeat protein [Paludibaculum fermentans]|uniref:O-linked N-acetylglucosamine transferase, SPINDLY family protein n=1 Tax=Paludibaculum fermentans TaxID=1473598 RepID=UPI003EBE169E